MKLNADLKAGTLACDGKAYSISNRVRTLAKGTRATKNIDVVRSIPNGKPYDPMPFPKGTWNITAVEWQREHRFDRAVFGPVRIRTDAWQRTRVWELDPEGNYLQETAETVIDSGYLLHFSQSSTTLGCIRLASEQDAETIARAVQAAFDRREAVTIEVV